MPLVMPKVTERTFEDYQLCNLPIATTIHDREAKQMEFMCAAGISSQRITSTMASQTAVSSAIVVKVTCGSRSSLNRKQSPRLGMREFASSDANHLGMPLPKGRVRFYRCHHDGQLEFTGENEIDHTAKNEPIRLYIGNAFDIAGERKQISFHTQQESFRCGSTDESFEIKLRNHKTVRGIVRVVEHLYRWHNWTATQEAQPHDRVRGNNAAG
jgi:hypothetical protein